MDIVFMGTPEFAVPTLEKLIEKGYNIKCVVTQPDRPKGRGKKLAYSPVKQKAMEHNIEVLQPHSLRKETEYVDKIKNIAPDFIVVVAFGQILPKSILSIPKYGCINVHASLLPKLRGAAPINWSIINGDEATGVTTMFMDEGIDTGDMLLKKEIKIDPDETAEELHDRLKVLGADLLIDTIEGITKNTIVRTPQVDSKYSYAPMLDKNTGQIDWNNPSAQIKNLVRGTNPWPAAYSFLNEEKIKICKVEIESEESNIKQGISGQVWKVDKEGIHVYTSDNSIIIKELQPQNGNKISAYSYTLGHEVKEGVIFHRKDN